MEDNESARPRDAAQALAPGDRSAGAILEVARSLLAELDLELVLDRVLESAQELTGARYAAVGVLNESKTELARFVTRGIDEQTRAAIGALPRGRGVLGTLIEHPGPLRLAEVGEHPQSYGFPHGHPPMHSFLGVPIFVAGSAFGNLYITEKAGGEPFTVEDENAVLMLAELAGLAIDHARRYTGTRERGDELERAVAALEATTQIAHAIGGETDLDVILELVAKRGRALVSARTLLIELSEGAMLVVAAGAGELSPGLVGQRIARAGTLADQAMRTLSSQRLEDELNRMRFDERGLGAMGISAGAGLAVPLVFRGTAHGVLFALDDEDGGDPAFSIEDQQLLEAFAASAAIAVATARAVSSERHRQRLAAEEGERRRWARELHDETLQSLSALRLGLAAALRSERAEGLAGPLGAAVEQLDETIANLRALITDLRPAALDQLGPQAALEGLAERARRRGMSIDMSVDLAYEQGRVSTRHAAELETAIYRIVQEALTNASKHGEATNAIVEVTEDATSVQISVRDDGSGFDPDAATDGVGLLGMRERVELLGGQLELESVPGSGTTVRVSLPDPVRRSALRGVTLQEVGDASGATAEE